MKFHLTRAGGRNLFTGYGAGYVSINDQKYEHHVVVAPDNAVAEWDAESFEALTPAHFEALLALKNGAGGCDLLISDYAMPHISGAEFVRRARQMLPDVPAIIITGYAEAEAVRDRPEGVEILLKPFPEIALQRAMARACGQAAAAS